MTNEDVLIQVIKNLIEENKDLKSSLEMHKHNYRVTNNELEDLQDKYNKLIEKED